MKNTIPKLLEVILYRNYRECKFDLLDFDHLKDLYRDSGWVSIDVSLLCGKKQYQIIENLTTDFIHSYGEQAGDVRVFKKNGLTYRVHIIDGMDPWSMIMVPEKIT